MRITIIAAIVAALVAPIGAGAAELTFYWRSPQTGVIQAKTVTIPSPVDPGPGQPEQPTGFRVTVVGSQSVARLAIVDLSPIVAEGIGPYVYSHLGRLPAGVTFNAATGRFSGSALKVGTFTVNLEVLDTGTGQSTGTEINLVVS